MSRAICRACDCDGDVESVFSKDDLITNACLYWLNGSVTTTLRLYADQLSRPWPLVRPLR